MHEKNALLHACGMGSITVRPIIAFLGIDRPNINVLQPHGAHISYGVFRHAVLNPFVMILDLLGY
jgi:hypothetical protein